MNWKEKKGTIKNEMGISNNAGDLDLSDVRNAEW